MQVPRRRISLLQEDELDQLLLELLRAQAYKCSADVTRIVVNTEEKARDAGSDGWSPTPFNRDPWLGDVETCWQFKAGDAGQPARIASEVLKPMPRKTLEKGGRFVVVASGSTNGVEGERARLEALREVGVANGIPVARIEVIGSERLTTWCNENPSVASLWAGRPEGVWRLSKWTQSAVHQVAWQSTPKVDAQITELHRDLDLQTGRYRHVHVHGHPGVGKTRFVLEFCRNAPWKDFVVYIPQAADVPVAHLIDGVVAERDAALVIVVDEVQYNQLRPLRDAIDYGSGRVRLVTIGHSDSPEPGRIQPLRVDPLSAEALSKIVLGWYPSMPREHVGFVVNFADGYVRLARLAADAVAQDARIDVKGLLDQAHIREFLDKMLGGGRRRSLYVVAALTSVGWIEERADEGRAIAAHLGMDWGEVQADVEEFHRRFGIAPRGGRLRYLSPTPLAIHLAVEAWTTYPDRMRSLPGVLPNDLSRDAYYERLQTIARNPQARKFAREELDFFFRADHFIDERATRQWSALTFADPERAAQNVMRALRDASIEERNRIQASARSELVWALVRLAWRSDSFRNSTLSLAFLAEAENAKWSNNSTGEFVERFQVQLGGSAVPYKDRLLVLDELLSYGRDELDKLVVNALAQVGNRQDTRFNGPSVMGEVPEPEWRPKTWGEYFECIRLACERLERIARAKPQLADTLVEAAANMTMLLRQSAVRDYVASFYRTLKTSIPETRERLRREVAQVLQNERTHWHELTEAELAPLDTLHAELTDRSLAGRLRHFVGPATWGEEQRADLDSLATDLLNDRGVLRREWAWLTSGEAGDGWRLGETLAKADVHGELEREMLDFPNRGPDFRLIGAYINTRRLQQGNVWFESWMEDLLSREPKEIALFVELFWRCGATNKTAAIFEQLLRAQAVEPKSLGQLSFGTWQSTLSKETLLGLLRELVRNGQAGTAAPLLVYRVKDKPEERDWWKSFGLDLATNPDLIRSRHMTNYYWKEIALPLISEHAKAIVTAILKEQARKDVDDHWFAEYSDAKEVLAKTISLRPDIVWELMAPLLSDKRTRARFEIGFPSGLVDKIPNEVILEWIEADPTPRASAIAGVVGKDFSTDSTLASQVLGKYGNDPAIAASFFSRFVSGSWVGESSYHWDSLASQLEGVAKQTGLPKLREWAEASAAKLRRMADEDRVREEEEKIRHR